MASLCMGALWISPRSGIFKRAILSKLTTWEKCGFLWSKLPSVGLELCQSSNLPTLNFRLVQPHFTSM
jgi:hypothetical protein